MDQMHGTTVLCVALNDRVAMAADGQVTLGQTVLKHGARKVRKLYKDQVLAGFAGGVADAFALFTRFEAKLEEFNGNLERAAVELVKDWRTDRALRRLEATLIVADRREQLLLSGSGSSSRRTTASSPSVPGGRTPWPRPAPSSDTVSSTPARWRRRASRSPGRYACIRTISRSWK